MNLEQNLFQMSASGSQLGMATSGVWELYVEIVRLDSSKNL